MIAHAYISIISRSTPSVFSRSEKAMPFIHVKLAGPQLQSVQTAAIQQGITSLMAKVLNKNAELTAVLVEQTTLSGWTIGNEVPPRAAHVDAIVSADTNTPEQKSQFIADVNALLQRVLGSDLPLVTYVVIHGVPQDSWGYGGLTQAHRAKVLV
jgi:4-oxalocrotonate tautomerase